MKQVARDAFRVSVLALDKEGERMQARGPSAGKRGKLKRE